MKPIPVADSLTLSKLSEKSRQKSGIYFINSLNVTDHSKTCVSLTPYSVSNVQLPSERRTVAAVCMLHSGP